MKLKKIKLSPKIKMVVLLVVLLILGTLLVKNKNLFVVASINGSPVWRWTLEQKLVSRYADQTIDEITSEVLIAQAAKSKGVTASTAEVSQKISDIEKSLNGKITLKDALSQQGMTMEDLQNQIKLQILMEKMTEGQVAVSDQEVSDYLENNKSLLVSTEEGLMKEEAKKAVVDSKKSAALRQFFTDLKAKAKISKYL